MGSRNIGVAVDFSSCSKAALRWAATNLTRNGDQLIVIHVNNSSQIEQGAMHLWEQSDSPLIPLVDFSDPHVTKTYGLSPDKETLDILAQVEKQRGVEVCARIMYGDPTKKVCESVDLVPLSCLCLFAGTMGSRNIGVAVDFSSCSKAALRWAATNLTRNGDQLIVIHVNHTSQNEQGAMHLWEQSGSPLIPLVDFSDPHVTKAYGLSPDKETLEILAQVEKQRGVEVCAKIMYGDPTKKVCQSVDLVPLSCLVIGSRGLSTLKRALMGSVSTYVVNHAACPVTVVKENM